MGCRVINGYRDGDTRDKVSVLYDSTSGYAFGPVFDYDQATEFLDWLSTNRDQRDDPREMFEGELDSAHSLFLTYLTEQEEAANDGS